MAKPDNPSLWDEMKRKYRITSHGSTSGKWSARKMVMARREYEKRGGGWEGDVARLGSHSAARAKK